MYRLGIYIRFYTIQLPFASAVWLFLLVICAGQTRAQGNLLVMPRRVVFDGKMKAQELNLANTGKDTARYSISIIDIRMKEDGRFEIISEPDSGQQFAGKYLRFFPRSVTLGPNESQVVKIQVSRSAEMPAGEYRSHIYFRAIPTEKPLGTVEPVKDSSISIRLVPVFGISIPVIIRVGETAAQVDFSDISFHLQKDSVPRLSFSFVRKGNRSVYGDFAVNFIPYQGKKIQVGIVKGLAVYTPNLVRHVQMDLDKTNGIDYHAGKLQLVYSTPADDKYAKYAEAEVLLH